MAAIYTLKVRTEIAASHIIEGHSGKCARLHGHNWKIDVEVQVKQLDPLGMGMDFADLKAETKAVTEPLDHRHLNDLPGFNGINPTAENVAAYVYREVSSRINTDDVKVSQVTIWETDRASVAYREE
ncbi:MAG: 6-carboxytetrahydropterin synthase QueD [Salinisphaeraceae bacterium]|nr:6-carboxytetrahydropterin synthase QueD [Salinisphaeraceae bacterium]